jgi:hypothetical protein
MKMIIIMDSILYHPFPFVPSTTPPKEWRGWRGRGELKWNMDYLRNKKIKITKDAGNNNKRFLTQIRSLSTTIIRKFNSNVIKPLKINIAIDIVEQITTLDFETIELNGKQIPILITMGLLENGIVKGKLFTIDHELLLKDHELA